MKPVTASKLSELPARRVPQTLADIIAAALADPDLKPNKRRDLVSAIKRFCKWRHVDPALVPASSRTVAKHFQQVHPKQVGKHAKTIANVRADVQAAIARYVQLEPPPRGKGLSPEWADLQALLPEKSDVRYRLSRLMGYCSRNGIAPETVDDSVAAQFTVMLSAATLLEHPAIIARYAILAWNKAAATIPTWPNNTLSVPSNRSTYCLPWAELPDSFRQDAEAWFEWNTNPDPLDNDAPLRPWTEDTYKSRQFSVRQLVSALHHRGHDIGTLNRLAGLVEVDTAKKALSFFLDAHERKTSSQISQLAHVLCAIAEHWVKVDAEHLKKLRGIKSRLAHKTTGLTPKNRARLRRLAERDNMLTFLSLPQTVLVRLKGKKVLSASDARDMQVAFAIELLLMAPIRRRSLLAVELGTHLLSQGRGRDRQLYLDLPATMVKNRVDLIFPLPRESLPLIDFYIGKCLPILRGHDCAWLFPGDLPDTHKHPDQFSRQFTKTIRRLTGLDVNIHLMRHFGAKLYLDANPGAYEVVRRVLAHKRMSTTVGHYTGLETESAIRHFDAVILNIRNGLLREDDDD